MYKINILSNRDFDRLPRSVTRGSDISDSLGFADPSTNSAYIRNTGVAELNKYLINHEFEHLLEEEGTHEDSNGIRHKKFFKDVTVPGLVGAVTGFLGGGPTGAAAGGLLGATKGLLDPASERRAPEPVPVQPSTPSGAFFTPTQGRATQFGGPEATQRNVQPRVTTGVLNEFSLPDGLRSAFEQRQRGITRGRSPEDIIRFA